MKKTVVKLVLNILITLLFLMLMEPKLTGMGLHEWGGLAIGLFFIVHILMHGRWIAGMTKNFRKKATAKARIKYILDWILLAGFSLIILSGMAISKTIDFSWLNLGRSVPWKGLHGSGAMLILAAVGIHLGLNWNWIKQRFAPRKQAERRAA